MAEDNKNLMEVRLMIMTRQLNFRKCHIYFFLVLEPESRFSLKDRGKLELLQLAFFVNDHSI